MSSSSTTSSSQEQTSQSQSHTLHRTHEKTSITVEREESGEHESAQSTPEHQDSNILDYFKPVKDNTNTEDRARDRSPSESSTNTDTSVETEKKDKKNKSKMADTEQQQHQIGLQDDNQSQGDEGRQLGGQDADLEKKIGEKREEVGEGPEATDEELDKVEARICEIVEGALKGIKPWLSMMVERCDEAEGKKRKSEDFDEKAFVESMKPIIKQASEILEGALAEINTLDPDKKCQRRAQRNAEDNNASPKQRKIADGLMELTTSVQEAIKTCKEKVANMPTAKSELDKMFGMLSQPLFQILSAVGLLVYGVLNLLGQILDAIGLGGALRGILDGLGLNKLINALGWKIQLVQTGNKK
jgi:hypothetical protein